MLSINIPSYHKVERALFELRRGFPVLILNNEKAFLLFAADTLVDKQVLNNFSIVKHITVENGFVVTSDAKHSIAANEFEKKLLDLIKQAELSVHAIIAEVDNIVNFQSYSFLNIEDLQFSTSYPQKVEKIVDTILPIEGAATTRIHVYRSYPSLYEHYALVVHNIQPCDKPTPIRIHSECFTGDWLRSLKCDCGSQLNAALNYFIEHGGGVLLYMRQEGRGIGLLNKMRAYKLQEQGMDTVEANIHLGFDIDERDFSIAAMMLDDLGFKKVNILTNNPSKIEFLKQSGINIEERIPLFCDTQEHNHSYVQTKIDKIGHLKP